MTPTAHIGDRECDSSFGKGFEFTSVGSAELKGLDEAVPLFEVTV